jgi:hypothetical protein
VGNSQQNQDWYEFDLNKKVENNKSVEKPKKQKYDHLAPNLGEVKSGNVVATTSFNVEI